jgi:hypothetical protein
VWTPPGAANATTTAPHADAAQQQAEKERAASLLRGVPPGGLRQLLYAAAVLRSFDPRGHRAEGEAGTSFFLIEEGEVEVQTQDLSGKPLVLAQLGPGEFFGEVSVLRPAPRHSEDAGDRDRDLEEGSGPDRATVPDVRSVISDSASAGLRPRWK